MNLLWILVLTNKKYIFETEIRILEDIKKLLLILSSGYMHCPYILEMENEVFMDEMM